MKIVIDIPEKRYKDIRRIAEVQLNRRTPTVEQIVANGTPLPKNHGRLIDADVLVEGEGYLISRKALLDKLQEHHDFYITAYGDRLDFRDLAPKDDKARVDEITTIQAFIMELPTIPQTDGERMTNEDLIKPMQVELEGDGYYDGEPVFDFGKCPKCGWNFEEGDKDWEEPYCCHCGQKLKWFETEEDDTYED